MTAPFPSRAQEEWRYADLEALRPVWDALAEPDRIDLAAGTSVEQVWLPAGEGVDVRRAAVTLGDGASLKLFALNTAADYGRIELDVTLGTDSDFELDAANIGGGSANLEIVTTVRHLGLRGRSRQTVRSVLGGKSVGTYLGKVAVARGAQQTDSEQSVKAMLLTRRATANCKPELEIFADDVKCAHGASVGELDPQMLFYAAARGLDPVSARALLLEGFVMGLWDDIADAGKRDDISETARIALRSVA